MAVLRANFLRYISHSNPNSSPARLCFYRGMASTLIVKGIAYSTTEDTVAKAFAQFGEVLEAKIIMDKVRNRSRGYGYVTFSSDEEAQKALMNMNGKVLDGRVVFLDNARPRYPNRSMPIARGPPEPAADS